MQSKMIPIQDKDFWACTGIGIVCRNIGPISFLIHFASISYYFLFLQVKIWFQNRRAKERRALKKHEEAIVKEKIDPGSASFAAAAACAAAANFGVPPPPTAAMAAAFGSSDSFHHPATSVAAAAAAAAAVSRSDSCGGIGGTTMNSVVSGGLMFESQNGQQNVTSIVSAPPIPPSFTLAPMKYEWNFSNWSK